MQEYRLVIGRKVNSLEGWNVEQCMCKRGLWGQDELTWTTVAGQVDQPALAYGAPIILLDATGKRRFVGRALEPVPIVEPGREGWSYRAEGPQSFLRGTPYQQIWRFRTTTEGEDEGVIIPTLDKGDVLTSLAILFRDATSTNGGKVNLRQQLDLALAQAKDAAEADGFEFRYDLTNVPEIAPAEDEVRDQMVADVMERALRWTPHVMPWWDMESIPPVLRFVAAQSIDAEGNWLPGGRVDGGPGSVIRSMPVEAAVTLGPKPMDNRLAKTVRINYLIQNQVEDAGQTYTWRSVETDESTVPNGAFGVHVLTVMLRGHVWTGEKWEEPEPRPPNGTARALHQAFGRVWWDLNFTVHREDVEWAWKPGEGWSITGAGARLASANSIAHTIMRDLRTGTTSVETGPPTFLDFASITDLMLAARLRNAPRHAGDATYGHSPEETDDEGDVNAEEHEFTTIEDTLPTPWLIKAKRPPV